jgi:ABC-type sulfate/molybdate transport systems ATPase subunit
MSIDIRNVSKQFGDFHALRDVSLDIESGELVALLGPSGCGKTTLLRIIAGLETADQGNILFSGEDKTAVQVRDRNVGFVFQHYALFRHMTVFENVAFGLRVKLRRWLRRLHDELHVTSIFVTHDQEEALEVADRVVLMNGGRVEQVGSPQEVWDHPASRFVYGFLGDVNTFHGRAHRGEVQLDGIQLAAPEHADADNAKALAYVRPHELDVARYSPGQAQGADGRATGIVVQLSRAIVVGPIARLELIAAEDTKSSDNPSGDSLIEAQIPAQQFRELGLVEGETLVVTPRRARVFVESAA